MTPKEALSHHCRYRYFHRKDDRNALIAHHYGFIVSVASRFTGPFLSQEEAVSAASLGCMEALKRYNPNDGAFTTFSYWWMRKYILLEKQTLKDVVQIPVGMLRQNRRLRKLRHAGRSDVEICQELSIELEELENLETLHESPTGNPNSTVDVVDHSPTPREALEDKESVHTERSQWLQKAMGRMSAKERTILVARNQNPPISLSVLAKQLQLSGEGVRKIYLAAVAKLTRSSKYKR